MHLRILNGSRAGAEFSLDAAVCLIGRSTEADIPLVDEGVLEHHALIERIGDRYLVRALEPAHPVLINGQPTPVEFLQSGDVIGLASVSATLFTEDDSVFASARPPHPFSSLRAVTIPAEQASASEPPTFRQIQASLTGDEVSALLHPGGGPHEPGESCGEVVTAATAWRAQEQLRVVYAINRLLGETVDPVLLLRRVLEVVIEAVGAVRGFAMLRRASGEGGVPELAVSRQRSFVTGEFEEGDTSRLSRTIVDHVLRSGEALLTADATQDQRFSGGDSIHAFHIESAMCVPLRGQQELMGVLQVEATREVVFTEDSLRLLACIGDMAGKVVEGVRLHAANLERQRLATVGKTLASTAHHIKNLLTGLSAGAELVDLGLQDRDLEAITIGWRPIRRSLDGIQDLVLNMLDFSKDRRPFVEELEPAELLGGLVELFRSRARGLDIDLELELQPGLPPLRGDGAALQRALLNLLINAIEAIPPGRHGRIVLACRQTDRGELAVSVADDGVGIQHEALPRVFDLFYSSKGSRGTGFGLAVTRKVVEEHQGRIAVATEPGRGTTFTLLLPGRSTPPEDAVPPPIPSFEG